MNEELCPVTLAITPSGSVLFGVFGAALLLAARAIPNGRSESYEFWGIKVFGVSGVVAVLGLAFIIAGLMAGVGGQSATTARWIAGVANPCSAHTFPRLFWVAGVE